MESKKRKRSAMNTWLNQGENMIQVQLRDGSANIYSDLLLNQCLQIELSVKNFPEKFDGPLFLLDFSMSTFSKFRVLLYTNQMPTMSSSFSDSQTCLEWCEVFGLCDFLEFELGKSLIIKEAEKVDAYTLVPSLSAMANDNHNKYMDIWDLFISKIVTCMSSIAKPRLTILNCYDSLRPGEGPRDVKDKYKSCCQHSVLDGVHPYYENLNAASETTSPRRCINVDFFDDKVDDPSVETFRCCVHGSVNDVKRGNKVHKFKSQRDSEWLKLVATLPDCVLAELCRGRLKELNTKISDLE